MDIRRYFSPTSIGWWTSGGSDNYTVHVFDIKLFIYFLQLHKRLIQDVETRCGINFFGLCFTLFRSLLADGYLYFSRMGPLKLAEIAVYLAPKIFTSKR